MANYKKTIKIIALLLISTVIAILSWFNSSHQGLGETGGYCYDNQLRYKLPKSGIVVRIHAEGFVERGSDSGTGQSSGTFTNMDQSDSLEFFISTDLDSIKTKDSTHVLNGNDRFWQAIGLLNIQNPNIEELNELKWIVYGASAGPKGTALAGQTNYIEVQETRLEKCKE